MSHERMDDTNKFFCNVGSCNGGRLALRKLFFTVEGECKGKKVSPDSNH